MSPEVVEKLNEEVNKDLIDTETVSLGSKHDAERDRFDTMLGMLSKRGRRSQ